MPVFLLHLRRYLWIVLAAGLVLLALCVILLVILRLTTMAATWRRRRLEALYRPLVDALSDATRTIDARARLGRAPSRHRDILGAMMLRTLRVTSGDVVDRLRAGASVLGLDRRWCDELRHRHSWKRADAAHALGLVREQGAVTALLPLIDDPSEDVRAAVVMALGLLADPRAIPPLIECLGHETRHQRLRIVEALQCFGDDVWPPLLASLSTRPALLPVLAELIGQLHLAAGVDQLVEWCGHESAPLRGAAFRALSSVGSDDRGYYHAVKALGDDSADVRAMAARVLGQSHRADASPYLEARLTDEWPVAAEAAAALRGLGATGTSALERAVAAGGPGADLARQMLWEHRQAPPAPA